MCVCFRCFIKHEMVTDINLSFATSLYVFSIPRALESGGTERSFSTVS